MILAAALHGFRSTARAVTETGRVLRSASRVAGAFETNTKPQRSDLETLGIDVQALPSV